LRIFRHFGGGKRDRTADLLHAMQALSQLSYTPFGLTHHIAAFALHLVGVET
jgi:hypothetical protein